MQSTLRLVPRQRGWYESKIKPLFYFALECAELYPALNTFSSKNLQLRNTQDNHLWAVCDCIFLHWFRVTIGLRGIILMHHWNHLWDRMCCALCVYCQRCAQNFPDNRVMREWPLLQYLDNVTVQVNSERIPYCRENEISTRSFKNST